MKGRMLWVLFAGLYMTWPAGAAQVAGVDVPDQVNVPGNSQPLVLNGAGVRSKLFIDIYVGALYLPQPQRGIGELLNAPPANRVLMHFVYREVNKHKLDEGWLDGFKNNLSAERFAALRPRLDQFIKMFRDMREGDRVWLDYLPDQGTRVSINGTETGVIPGADFNAALLAVWLGDEPVSKALKNAMVGVDK